MQLLLQQYHDERTFVLAGDSGPCLTFNKQSGARSPTVQLALVPRNDLDLTSDGTRKLAQRIFGCLGVLSIGHDLFIGVIEAAASVGRSSGISRILAVSFHCLTSGVFDDSSLNTLSPDYESSDIDLSSVASSGNPVEHPCAGIRKYLSSGSFYFSSTFDISSRLQTRLERGTNDVGIYDERFLWNSYAVDCLLSFRNRLGDEERAQFDQAGFATLTIQGYVSVLDLSLPGTVPPVSLSVISRLGWQRAGTRFLTRGLDDDGNVANFVETETLLRSPSLAFSYVQIRGSVPVFWEQQGLQPFVQKLQITRPQIASQPAFDKHFMALLDSYPKLHILNLLGTRDHEEALTRAYGDHLSAFRQVVDPTRVGYTAFDFHSQARAAGGIENIRHPFFSEAKVSAAGEAFAYCLATVGKTGEESEIIQQQEGGFRSNCLDCLDRTNVVQEMLSRGALESFVLSANPAWLGSDRLWSSHRELWAENGDALSKIYAGTGALNTSFTRSGKRTFAGALADAGKSFGRVIQANFADKDKQASVDGLLGNLAGQMRVTAADPIHDALDGELEGRANEFSTFTNAAIYVGSWNLNARPKSPGDSLLAWLFPDPSVEPDIMAIGFQELVDLNASQVLLATDPEKRRKWEEHIMQSLSQRRGAKADYVILRSAQLVGAALILLVKTSVIGHVRNVEMAIKKTGLKGVAGNKGAVAVRLIYHDTSICFVTAHLAAGHSNVDDRNRDYQTISTGLHFLRGKTIDSHDNVIWMGDFNYRISLPGDQVRQLVNADDFGPLLDADQLRKAQRGQYAFDGYEEGPITFRPTYRYDIGTQTYDSSEKMRIPAWTDRVLYKGEGLDLNRYNRAELLGSDHRPVMALLRARVRIIDQPRRDQIRSEVLSRLMKAAGTPAPAKMTGTPHIMSSRERKPFAPPIPTRGVASVKLPPPSSAQQAWWEDTSADRTFIAALAINPFDDETPTAPPRAAPPIPHRPSTQRERP